MYDKKYNGKIIFRDNADDIGIRSLRFSQLVDELFDPVQNQDELNFVSSYIKGKIDKKIFELEEEFKRGG